MDASARPGLVGLKLSELEEGTESGCKSYESISNAEGYLDQPLSTKEPATILPYRKDFLQLSILDSVRQATVV
jgi:hypothetical protein